MAVLLEGEASAPHFDLPFRFTNNGVVCVEQDTSEDVANCVEAIVRYPQGWIDDNPEFGIPSLEFENEPISSHFSLLAIIKEQEPRATLEVVESLDYNDISIDHIEIRVD